MKRILAILICLVIAVSLFSACGSSSENETADTSETTVSAAPDTAAQPEEIPDSVQVAATEPSEPIKIVTTIFPIYDWVREVLGDKAENAELIMLLDNGVDLHSYQPTVDDIVEISTCDIFIYVGGESDEWVEDALAESVNPDMQVVNLLEVLGDQVKEEEVVDGMEADHDHEHGHEHAVIEAEDIMDRALAEFSGEWKSLAPMLTDGSLDAYVEHTAEENGTSEDETKQQLTERWACDAVTIAIDGSMITFTYADGSIVSGDYAYAGYTPIMDEDGDITGVRYQFETDSADAPRYVQFNDHGHEPAEEVEHFHIYFGHDSFEALMDSSANPFFVPASADAEEVLEELMGGHNHDNEDEEDHEEGHDHEHEEGEVEYDEHVWLSLRNAQTLCGVIAGALSAIDPDNSDVYSANAGAYDAELEALDEKYAEAVAAAPVHTVLFGDRFPFRYMVDDYDLDYYAAFVGCSAETEASFETIVFLAGKVDELGLGSILQIESADGSIARTIRDTTQTKDQQILTMDSLQATTSKDVSNGVTYLAVMESNLDVLRAALNN